MRDISAPRGGSQPTQSYAADRLDVGPKGQWPELDTHGALGVSYKQQTM